MVQVRRIVPGRRPVAAGSTGPWRRLAGAGAALVAGAVMVAAAPAPGTAAATRAARPGFQAALEQLVADGVPGAAGLARRGGQVITAASGAADVATGRPMAAADRFRVGSITKTLVATVVLQLAGEHRLRLSDSIARWLPGLVPNGQDITVRELLQHTSGLYNYTDDPGFLRAFRADPARVWQPQALIRIAVAHPPLFPPGTFGYSNTDYVLLGLIIQAATGQPLGRELQDRIFVPLGMRHTSLPFAQVIPPSPYAHGYLLGLPGGPLDLTRVSPSWAWAAGAVVSTAADLARFYTALLTGRILPSPLLHQMLTTVPDEPAGIRYGLGIFSLQTPCGTAWGHNGDFPGYFGNALTTLGGSRQVIVLINAESTSLTTQQTADVVAAVVAGLCGHP